MPRSIVLAVVVMIMLALGATTARAQATRTWVSGVGDDSNPCTRPLPCKSFANAIGKTASGGVIEAIDSGNFGALTITKSITIDSCCLADVLVTGTNGIVINAGPTGVVNLRHLNVQGNGTGLVGVFIAGAGSVVIEDCEIYGFTGRGISDVRTAPGSLAVRNTVVKQNAGGGVAIAPSASTTLTAVFDHCAFQGNGGAGLALSAGANASVSRSTAADNAGAGFVADGVAGIATLSVDACVTWHNTSGIVANGSSSVVRVSDTEITFNSAGINPTNAGVVFSYGNNRLANNATNGTFSTTIVLQ